MWKKMFWSPETKRNILAYNTGNLERKPVGGNENLQTFQQVNITNKTYQSCNAIQREWKIKNQTICFPPRMTVLQVFCKKE